MNPSHNTILSSIPPKNIQDKEPLNQTSEPNNSANSNNIFFLTIDHVNPTLNRNIVDMKQIPEAEKFIRAINFDLQKVKKTNSNQLPEKDVQSLSKVSKLIGLNSTISKSSNENENNNKNSASIVDNKILKNIIIKNSPIANDTSKDKNVSINTSPNDEINFLSKLDNRHKKIVDKFTSFLIESVKKKKTEPKKEIENVTSKCTQNVQIAKIIKFATKRINFNTKSSIGKFTDKLEAFSNLSSFVNITTFIKELNSVKSDSNLSNKLQLPHIINRKHRHKFSNSEDLDTFQTKISKLLDKTNNYIKNQKSIEKTTHSVTVDHRIEKIYNDVTLNIQQESIDFLDKTNDDNDFFLKLKDDLLNEKFQKDDYPKEYYSFNSNISNIDKIMATKLIDDKYTKNSNQVSYDEFKKRSDHIINVFKRQSNKIFKQKNKVSMAFCQNKEGISPNILSSKSHFPKSAPLTPKSSHLKNLSSNTAFHSRKNSNNYLNLDYQQPIISKHVSKFSQFSALEQVESVSSPGIKSTNKKDEHEILAIDSSQRNSNKSTNIQAIISSQRMSFRSPSYQNNLDGSLIKLEKPIDMILKLPKLKNENQQGKDETKFRIKTIKKNLNSFELNQNRNIVNLPKIKRKLVLAANNALPQNISIKYGRNDLQNYLKNSRKQINGLFKNIDEIRSSMYDMKNNDLSQLKNFYENYESRIEHFDSIHTPRRDCQDYLKEDLNEMNEIELKLKLRNKLK